ncbi:MAG: hypothetical protein JWO49_2400 [Arthrobacter sp.]|nr:hypothetical protein [Arthrobacter sp.]MCU1548089.1 hypothetical protein [Arthrobacter sp.]
MIPSPVPGAAAAGRRRVELAGMVGPVLFVSVFTVYGRRPPGYSSTRMFVSELSVPMPLSDPLLAGGALDETGCPLTE